MGWKTESSKEVYVNKWMIITEDVVVDGGKRITYGVIHKKPFSLVIPWDGTYFTLVRQYRYPVGMHVLEFPAGHVEEGESPEDTARRELKEEAGFSCKILYRIGSVQLAPGAVNQEGYIFLATDLSHGEQQLEESEDGMTTHKVTQEELEDLIRKGEVRNGPTLAAFALLLAGEYIRRIHI